jgi:hypothetical protein
MRRVVLVLVTLSLPVLFALALAQQPGQPPQGERPGQPPAMQGAPGRPGMMPFPPDSFAAERDSLLRLTLDRIKGREGLPAESVFRNVKVMQGVPAERFLQRMNAFGRALGVPCSHCHILNHWADEDKPAKLVARDMMAMTMTINDTLLTRVRFKRRDPEPPRVNCFTCHRGEPRPGGMRGPGRPPGQGAPGAPGGPPAPGGDRR